MYKHIYLYNQHMPIYIYTHKPKRVIILTYLPINACSVIRSANMSFESSKIIPPNTMRITINRLVSVCER